MPASETNGGTWQVQVTQLGAQSQPLPGITDYVGLHGTYTGTLPIDDGTATGTVDQTVVF